MALDILHENWGPYTHTEVANALKAYLAGLEDRINHAIQSGGVGLADLSNELKALLNKANTALQPENIAAWAKAQNKPGYTVSEITYSNLLTLAQKLDDMDQKIQAAGQSGGVDPDDEMSSTSENVVQNKVIKAYVDAVSQRIDTLLGSGNVQGAIDTFNEVVAFLNGISSSDTLAAKLAQLATDISGKVEKETGKSLMTADEHTKLQNLPTAAELADMIDEIEAGETVVVNSDGANIVDEHDNNSVLLAPSARQMKLMYSNVMALYNALSNTAFINGKPTLDWVGQKTKYTLSYNLTGCTADVAAGQVNEGALRIKLTPSQASYAFTSVTVNGNNVQTTSADDGLGSVFLDIVVNGNITVAATAISGRAINFSGTGCSIGAAGVAIGEDLDTTITADEHFTLPSSITVKIGNTNVTHTYTRASGNKTATLHIDAANITGDLTITCTADEDAHAVLNLSNVGSGVTVNKANNAHVYEGDTITILPASGKKVTASATIGGNAATLTGDTYAGYSYTIGSGDVSSGGTEIAITASATDLQTYSIDLTGLVGVTSSNAATSIQEGAPYSTTLSKTDPSASGNVIVGTCTMANGTLTISNNVISTDHVTGNIVLAATVGAAQMKVHSYNQTPVSDGDGHQMLEDGVNDFNLFNNTMPNDSYSNLTANTYGNRRVKGSQSFFGNGGDCQLPEFGSFTIHIKNYKPSDSGSAAYAAYQMSVGFNAARNSVQDYRSPYTNAKGVFRMQFDTGGGSNTFGTPRLVVEYRSSVQNANVRVPFNEEATIERTATKSATLVYDSTTQTLKAYIDGVKKGSDEVVDTPLTVRGINVNQTNGLEDASKHFSYDSVDVYNYAMTDAQVAELITT